MENKLKIDEKDSREFVKLMADVERGKIEIDKFKNSFADSLKGEMGSELKEDISSNKEDGWFRKFVKKIGETCK